VEELAGQAARSSLEDLGSATVQADIATLRHETQVSRLFRT
jgi:urease accessory protein